MDIQNNRLQLLCHEEVFSTREKAVNYINKYYCPDALKAEPAIVFYGEATAPNVILVIGTVDREAFIIDVTELKDAISGINSELGEDGATLTALQQSLDEVIAATGLVFNTNKIKDQITYEKDVKDVIIGNAESMADAIAKLSAFVQQMEKDSKFTVESTESVALTMDEDGELTAEVNISHEGEDNGYLFDDNIIGVKSDGIFASVNLRYDEENNRLVFTSSGYNKKGQFVTDAKKQIVSLGEAPTAKTVPYKGGTVFTALNKLENDFETLDSLDVQVNAAENTLTITVGDHTKKVNLPGVDIISSVRYDKRLHQLDISFKNGSTAIVPLDDLFKEYHFTKSETIELHEHVNEDGSSTIYGDVILSSREDNVLKSDETGLYIKSSSVGVSMTDVNEAIRAAVEAIEETIRAEVERAREAEAKLASDLGDEATERERVDTEIRNELATEATRLGTAIGEAVRDEKDRALAAENALKSQLDNEVAQRTADVRRVETEVVPQVERSLNDKLVAESERAIAAENANATAVATEKARAEVAETGLSARIDTATADVDRANASVETVKTDLAAEINRAKEKEGQLGLTVNSNKDAVNKEIADRKESEAVITAGIAANQTKLDVLNGTVDQTGSVRNIIAEQNRVVENALANEIDRAKTAEGVLGQRIDGIVTTGSANLATAKAYTDAETERARAAEEGLKGDIQELNEQHTTLSETVASKVGEVKVEKVDGNDLVYQLLVDGVPCGVINIPRDHFFKSASFDDSTHILTLNFSTPDDIAASVSMDMSSLMQVYKAGNGLAMSDDNTFSVVKNEAGDEGYLVIDTNGICVKGINAALLRKANVGDSYTKGESDAEYAKLRGEDGVLRRDLNLAVNDARTALEGKVSEVSQQLASEVSRATSKEGTIERMVEAYKTDTDKAVNDAKAEIASAKAKTDTNERAIADEKARAELMEQSLDGRIAAAEGKLDTLNGGVGTPGSVLDSIQLAKSELNTTLTNEVARAKEEETRIKAAGEKAHADLTAAINKASADAKTYTDSELAQIKDDVAQNTADINAKVGSVTLEQPDGGADYILMVDGVNIGTIRTQQRGGVLTGVTYLNGILTLNFNVDGVSKIEQIDFNELLDEVKDYTAGDGLVLDNGTSFRVLKDNLSEEYLYITDSGVGIRGIDTAIADSIKVAIDPVNAKIGTIEGNIIEINTKLNEVKENAETAKAVAESSKAVVDALREASNATAVEVVALKGTIKTLQDAVADLTARLQALEDAYSTHTDFGTYDN